MSWNRAGTLALSLAGAVLAGLMAYTLFFPAWRSGPDGPVRGDDRIGAAARVAVFLPDGRDWFDFRRAVGACAGRGIVRVATANEDALIVESARTGRRVRFDRHGVRGVSDTREAVGRLGELRPPPIAVVGSTTTVLTVALAEPLREEGAAGPVLLIPWATAVMVERSGGGRDPAGRSQVPLIEIDPGRTFRFCPNNRRLADSVVDCVAARDGGRLPGRVFLVVDPFDPYSDDLAACFRRSIRARKPDVEIVERADAVDLPSFARPLDPDPEPSAAEVALADSIVAVGDRDEGRTTWVVLPLQDQPARRMIAALRRRASWRAGDGEPRDGGGATRLRVVCGDAIERQALDALAGRGGLSLWCASTSSSPPSAPGVGDDTQALAEITSALAWAVDQAAGPAPTPDEVRAALRRIDLAAGHPGAFGRELAFDPDGERRGDPERVLELRSDGIGPPVEYARRAGGGWEPVPAHPGGGSP